MAGPPDQGEASADPARALRFEAALGALAWLALPRGALVSAISMPWVEELLAAGMLVAAPLVTEAGIRGAGPAAPRRLAWAAAVAWLVAAPLAVAAMAIPPGPWSAARAVPWLGFAALVAALGLRRMGVRGPAPVHELAVDAAHLYLPVGAAWFVASRAGWEPLGFDALITALTAVHFHFAGLAAPAIAGQVGRLLVAPGPAYRLGAGLVALTPLLVALGILGSPVLEVAMASLLAAGVVLVAGVVLFQVAPHHGHAGRALAASQLVSLYTMGLAVRFAWGEFSGVPALGIAEMITSHGRLNALGFALPSLALLAWLAPPREAWPDAIPLPALRAGLRVGPGWYAAAGWAAPAGTPGPTGLLPSLADFLGREFPGTEVDPDLARYYEDPSSLDLVVRPRWAPGFRLAGWLVETLAARVGQLVLPGGTETRRITHALIPLARPVPGLEDAVGSYRAYESGGPMFVAIYGTHQDATSTYMDVALPLPGGTLHSVLRGEPLPGEPPGLRLSSTRGPDRPAGHEGLWWRLGPLVLRLPLHEELEAWPARAPGATATAGFGGGLDAVMLARHRFRVLGIPCLRLEYELLPARPADA